MPQVLLLSFPSIWPYKGACDGVNKFFCTEGFFCLLSESRVQPQQCVSEGGCWKEGHTTTLTPAVAPSAFTAFPRDFLLACLPACLPACLLPAFVFVSAFFVLVGV